MRPTLCRDVATEAGAAPLGDLPEWDLSDLYTSPEADEFSRDLDWLDSECSAFAADYESKLASLDADALLACV